MSKNYCLEKMKEASFIFVPQLVFYFSKRLATYDDIIVDLCHILINYYLVLLRCINK